MFRVCRLFPVLLVLFALLALATPLAFGQAAPKADAPVLVTSCGQSPGPLKLTVFLKRLGVAYEYKADATTADLAGKSSRRSSSSPGPA
jgi:hypothetical protein